MSLIDNKTEQKRNHSSLLQLDMQVMLSTKTIQDSFLLYEAGSLLS